MKFVITGFPLVTITLMQHLGASLPLYPICVLVGLSTFALTILILRLIYSLMFHDDP